MSKGIRYVLRVLILGLVIGVVMFLIYLGAAVLFAG